MWLEGYHVGDHVWQARAHRELDHNWDPSKIEDLSANRGWYQEGISTEHQVFSPKPGKPVMLESVPMGFCTNSSETPKSTMKFYVTGTWNTKLMKATPPSVDFVIKPKVTSLYTWQLRAGSKTASHAMDAWSVLAKQVTTNITTQLEDLGRNFENPNFNLTISCSEFPKFKTELNVWVPGPLNPRNSTNWDSEITVDDTMDYTSVKQVLVQGALVVEYAGFSQPGCLSLTSTGLVVARQGDDCDTAQEAVCEHQGCYTKEGNQCIFPFSYKGVIHNKCTSVDVYQPWCATGKIHSDVIVLAFILEMLCVLSVLFRLHGR